MSGTATIAITVGVAVAVLVGFFIVYYLGNVANSIYDVKVGVRKDFDKKVKELQEWVEKDTKQRIGWMRDENREDTKRFKEGVEGHLEETFGELQKTVERLRADVSSLQSQMIGFQEGKDINPALLKKTASQDMNRMPAPAKGPGDIDLARVGIPQSENAPDMDVPKQPSAIRDKPSPPPPPSSARQPQPAGRASIEQKTEKKKKKRRDPDAFETFDQFSEDFKAGGK